MAKHKKRHNPFALARVSPVRPVVIRQTRVIKAKRRHHRRGGGASMGGIAEVAIASAGLAYLASNVPTVADLAAKIPGSKTFGNAGALGLACLVVDRFVYKNKYLKLAGIAGVVISAVTLGTKGQNFQWLGTLDGDIEIPDAA